MGVRVEPISFTRKNIALVSVLSSPLADPGSSGAGSQGLHVAGLAAALAALGHRVVVYTRRDHPHVPQLVHSPRGYEVVHVPAGPPVELGADEVLAYAGDLVEFLELAWKARRPDVVHAHGWLSGIAAVLSARNSLVPVVQTYHSLGTARPQDHRAAEADSTKRVAVERLIGHEVALVVATSSAEARAVLGMGVDRSKLVVVPKGVDLDLFAPRPSAVDRHRPRRIVSVGRLLPHKGFDDLIGALSTVEGAELVIAGGGAQGDVHGDQEARRLLAVARSAGVGDRVVFAGHVPYAELPALLRSADVVACTPRERSSGGVALEAMACGTPVLATAVGGLVDVVVDGLSGVLVPPGKPDATAKSLRALLADGTYRELLSVAGRDRALARYSWHRVASDLVRVYATAVTSRGIAPRHVRARTTSTPR
ncbi:glycosyltransferase [Lentzea albida]|uniref:Glycosyltransferase involved in cell wall bisynthesis n=1 Tax=Lentzea albida TaxID=65499 RepID=A0A1H9XAW2_9PSEU|nr:glycosyltransferase [Lentzea albida]SES43262.1 Glycosyltransferase involved in cell wall bisynthesis [Lentzea albida]